MPKKRKLSPAELQIQAWQFGYKAALADLIEFAAQDRSEPFDALKLSGECKRGRKLRPGRRSFEVRNEQMHRELMVYEAVKSLVEKSDVTVTEACRKARQMFYKEAGDDSVVKKIYYRLRRIDQAGTLWVPENETHRRERRWRRFFNEVNIYPPIYGPSK